MTRATPDLHQVFYIAHACTGRSVTGVLVLKSLALGPRISISLVPGTILFSEILAPPMFFFANQDSTRNLGR